MNTIIEKCYLRDLRVMDFFQTQTNISKHLQAENLETLKLADVYNKTYLPAFNALDEVLKPIRKTGLTDPLLELDNERDDSLVGLNAHIKAFLRFPEQAKANAAKTDLNLIGAVPYVTKLEEDNAAFESLYNDRTRIEAAVETGKAKAARIDLQEAFALVVQTINALALLGGDAPYRRLADNINREVQQALTTVKQRSSARDKNKEEEK